METKLLENLHKNTAIYDPILSKQYAPISTELLLQPFFDKGWYKHKNIKSLNKEGLGKESITLRNNDFMYSNGDFLTVECLNSNNGTSALVLMGGYGRIVCSNGLVLGDIKSGRFVHRGTKIYEKINNKYDEIIAHLNGMKKDVETLKDRELDNAQVYNVIDNIAKRVFNKDTKKQKIEVIGIRDWVLQQVNQPRRRGDYGNDAFTRMNVVQENIIRNGALSVRIEKYDKESGTQEIKTVSKNRTEGKIAAITLNKIITEEFLKIA